MTLINLHYLCIRQNLRADSFLLLLFFWIMCSLRTPRPICRLSYQSMLDRYVGRYSGRHSINTLTVDYRRNISRVSVVYRSTVLNQKFRLSV